MEAKFIEASDAGEMVLYLTSILQDLGIAQHRVTILYRENVGVFKMDPLVILFACIDSEGDTDLS